MANATERQHIKRTLIVGFNLILLQVLAGQALAQAPEDVAALRRQVTAQEALVREQRELLQKQQEVLARLMEQIEGLKQRMGELERAAGPPAPAAAPPSTAAGAAAQEAQRDRVGDLNSGSVAAGTFPGSFVIPGSREVSLAVGGFIKTVAITDSAAEALGTQMLPSTLGTQRDDTRGAFAIDSTMTRLNLDARAPAGSGFMRGYIEYDLNGANNGSLGFKLRHAYGTWQSSAGTVTAGHTWSTFMDLGILPDGLTEPTVSGAIFQRQAILRWTQPLGEGLKADFGIEDPGGPDVFNQPGFQSRSTLPDFITAVEYRKSGTGHVRLGGIVRRIEQTNEATSLRTSATGWGLSMGVHLETFGKDRLAFSGSYGKGLGRYLLGLGSTAGGVLDPDNGRLSLRDNYGGLFWYQHFWNSKLRSTGAIGHARSQPFDRQPGDAFKSTTYTYGNLMWTVLPYLSLGFEYDYGRRALKDWSYKDNHRVMIGMQIF